MFVRLFDHMPGLYSLGSRDFLQLLARDLFMRVPTRFRVDVNEICGSYMMVFTLE